MALEIPNAIHACGLFVGVDPVPAPFASVPPLASDNMVSSDGVRAFERIAVGEYLATMDYQINGAEALVQCRGTLNFTGTITAQINDEPVVPPATTPETGVYINAYDSNGNAVDVPFFSMLVIKLPGGKSLALPVSDVPPAGGAGLPFSAGIMVAATVSKLLVPGVLNRVNAAAGAFSALLPTALQGRVPGMRIYIKNVSFGVDDDNLTIDGAGANIENPTSAIAALAATVTFANAAGMYLVYEFDGTQWVVVGFNIN